MDSDFFIFIFAYFLGSIPFGFLLTKMAGLGDIRAIGSGNIGATNVLRTGKKGLAAATLLLDGGKGTAAVLLAELIMPGTGAMAGLASLMGHLFPVWLKFKGGKGVATSLGVLLALAWPVGLTATLIWIGMIVVFRYSSLAAMVALSLTPALAFLMGYDDILWLTFVIAVLVLVKHKHNIRRLMDHTEPKVGKPRHDAQAVS